MNLWKLSFRPFFLFGALFSLLAIALWMGYLFWELRYSGPLDPVVWHSHEMIYGFAGAVIAGFVLTAVQNWSGKPGVRGTKLQLLFIVWATARILLVTYPEPSLLVSGIDLVFFPLLASYLAPYLRDRELKTERIFLAYFFLFFMGNLLVHLDSLGIYQGYAVPGIRLGLHAVILVIIFMGGRVIPFFTESSIAKSQPKIFPKIEILSHVSAWAFLISQFIDSSSKVTAGIAFFAALIHTIRLQGWYVRRLRKVPIIWVLHLAYFWIVIGLFLSGLASLGMVQFTLAIHAFTVGAIGSIIYGMITRVSLGHTGRKLKPSLMTVLGYVLINLAAAIRVVGPMIGPTYYKSSITMAGGFWIAAFALFVIEYAPILISPRVDGRDG